MKRSKLLKLGDDAKKTIQLPFKLRKEQKSLEQWILEKEEAVAVLESDINDLKADDKLDVDKILDKVDELDLTKRRLKQGEDLMEELFK